MIFPTIQFAAFFAVVLTASWLLMPQAKYWKPFMLAASYTFYGYADWRFVILLLVSTVANQAAATIVARTPEPRRRRQVVAGAVVVDLALLGWFKYVDFCIGSVNALLGRVGLGAPVPLLQVALPVGISFFTFQAISYVVDVHLGRARLAKPIDFAVYLAFFPHLVAGPIVRAREFLPQLATPRDPRRIPAGPALFLIAGGLIKKIVLADVLATRLVDPVFASPGAHSAGEVLVGVYGYAVQIYCDFSAYTDMAIGLALLLGFQFPQNFDRPYRATSLQDFWRRWHMTLSRWLRDYLYIPLGGNRGPRVRTYRNLALTMLLGGLWHGAAWTFVVWGGLHGAGLAAERWWQERRGRPRIGVRPGVPESPAEPPGRSGAATAVLPPVVGTPVGARSGAVALLPPSVQERLDEPLDAPQDERLNAPLDERLDGQGVQPPPWRPLVSGVLTFHVVCLAWVFFRAPTLGVAIQLLSRLFHWGPMPLVTVPVLLAIAVGLGVQFVPQQLWDALQRRFTALAVWQQGLGLGLLLVVVNAIVGEQGVAPFLYFRF